MNDNTALKIASVKASSSPSGYYRCIEATGDFEVGNSVYLLGPVADNLKVLSGESVWHLDPSEFYSHFVYDPKGAHDQQERITKIMEEIGQLQTVTEGHADILASFNPHVDESGNVSVALTATSGSTALQAKKAVAEIRNRAARSRQQLELKQKALERITKEQSLILREKIDALQELLSKAEEAIWTVNLYLGTEEEIIRLSDGEPASIDEPIAVRQLVLYMDEECAVASDIGGIDHRRIDSFDAWLLENPSHLQQVFPEQRGVVALKPRRHKKEYHDSWANVTENAENRRTYFLLRNGENLYRMWTDFQIDDRLIPRSDEFTAFFHERHYNHSTREYEEIVLRPGSHGFMLAEKKADSTKRHYMRVALILQGLIDRTTIFQPLAGHIDVTKPEAYEHDIRVILDADSMLSDSRERFANWLHRINSRLEPGMRIIGCFGNYDHGLPQYARERCGFNSRLIPTTSVFPSSEELYAIEEERGDMLAFKYARTEDWKEYKNRATCLIEKTDRFILSFDATTVGEMRFYLHCRLDREHYSYLFPLLKTAIKLKLDEAAIEAPFRLLLTGDIMKRHGISLEEAKKATDELVEWWKFKNRTHRALTSDDSKAYRMILEEFRHRLNRATERDTMTDELRLAAMRILELEPDALLIAHKKERRLVVYVPANTESVFVHEQSWMMRRTDVVRVGSTTWKTVDAHRYRRWDILYMSPKWHAWAIGADPKKSLIDAEREKAVEYALEWCNNQKNGYTPLAIVVSGVRVDIYYQNRRIFLDDKPLTGQSQQPEMARGSFGWTKAKGVLVLDKYPTMSHFGTRTDEPWNAFKSIPLWISDVGIADFKSECARWSQHSKQHASLRDRASKIFDSVKRWYVEEEERHAYEKFMQEYGDPDLWDGHKKTLKLTQMPTKDLWDILNTLVEHDVPLEGKNMMEITMEASQIANKSFELPGVLETYIVSEGDERG